MPSEDQDKCVELTTHQLAALLLKCPDVPVLVPERQPDLSIKRLPATMLRPYTGGDWGDMTGIDYVTIEPAELSKAWEGTWQINKLS